MLFIGASSQINLVSNDYTPIANVAYGQNSNDTSIVIPSNMSKFEITLKTKVDNSNSILDSPFFVGIISALSAISGVFLGTFLTNRSNRQMEKRISAADHEIASTIRSLLLENLNTCAQFLDGLEEKGKITKEFVQNCKVMLTSTEGLYRELPIQLKASVFKSEVLISIQGYYDAFNFISAPLFSAFSKYEEEVIENESPATTRLENEISKLNIPSLKKILQSAINILKSNI
jgi:hypothetical protein